MILAPQSKLKGASLKVKAGMVQVTAVDADMSQFVSSSENVSWSLFLMVTMYPVMGEPPSSGAVHETITSSGTQVVTGAIGFAGS